MNFDDLDRDMRAFETAADVSVPEGVHMVARIDGRGFTRLTKEIHRFDAPFDVRFRDLMVETTRHLMDCGFRVLYGYTQSDEISLLFHPDETCFGRKLRKYDTILAGEASAQFSVLLGARGAFDCRISQLPTDERVVDYFRWRSEDARRNALNAHCYWALRSDGLGARAATARIEGLSVEAKRGLLESLRGLGFEDLPLWQRRGIGLEHETYEKGAEDPRTGDRVTARRRRIGVQLELPEGDEYGRRVRAILAAADRS